ncbi:hypothetical protein Tco_1211057 [Tanacetum coccineum]
MNTLAQKSALNNALVSPDNRVKIGKCNIRIIPTMKKKEPTYQVVLDALALSPLYPAFLITYEVPKIYMQQFWHTITKIKDSSSYQFKLDKKKCRVDVEVFRDILQIRPRLPNQEVVEPLSSDEELVSFIKELGYKGDIKSVTEVVTDHMHQPWRTFAAVINRRLSGKTTEMTNLKMQNSPAYKTFLAYAIGAIPPKKARKFKKPASPSKKKTLVVVEEPAEKPTKKPAARRQSAGVQIRDTLGMSVSKWKAPAKAERSKGIELMSEVALLEEAQLKKAIQRSKQETDIHQAGGSSEGAGLKPEVPDEPKGKSIDTSEGIGLKLGVLDVSKSDSSESEYESWGDSDDDDYDNDQQRDDERTESDDDKSADLNKTESK